LGRALPLLLSPLFPLLGVGLLLRCVRAAATVWSWPSRASHRVSAAFTMAAAVPRVPARIVSLIDGGRRIKNIERKRLLSGDTPGGKCCLSFPMRTLGLNPAFPWEGEAIQSKIATCPFQTAQAKYFSKNQTALLSRCRHQGYLKCPVGLAWAGWQGH
jgi:hypothetical protein